MSAELYILLVVFACFLTLVYSLVFVRKAIKEEVSCALKQDISVEQMRIAEERVACFYTEHGIQPGADISDIGMALKVCEGWTTKDISKQAHLNDANKEGIMFVTFKEGLSAKNRKFVFAHECGHIINGDMVPVDRPDGRNKEEAEQLADYVAAALLMPLESVYAYLEDNDYQTASPGKRIKLAQKLSKLYGVDDILALRRVKEVWQIKNS